MSTATQTGEPTPLYLASPPKRRAAPKPAKLVVPARPALVTVADIAAVVCSAMYYAVGTVGLAVAGLLATVVAVLGRRAAHRNIVAPSVASDQPKARRWQLTTTRKSETSDGGRAKAGKTPGDDPAKRGRRGLPKIPAIDKATRVVRTAASKAGKTKAARVARSARPAGAKVAEAAKGARTRAGKARRTGRSLGALSRANSAHPKPGRKTWGALAPWRVKSGTRRGKAWRGLMSAGTAGTAAGRGAQIKRRAKRQAQSRPGKRLRGRVRHPGEPAGNAEVGPMSAPAPKPAGAPTSGVPGQADRRPTAIETGARNMKFHQSAQEMAASASRYAPENMHQVYQDFGQLPQALAQIAAALRTTTQRAGGEWPMRPAVVETLAAVHGLLVKAAEASAQVAPAMRRVHADDLARYEQPRINERLWNVPGGNRTGGSGGQHRAQSR